MPRKNLLVATGLLAVGVAAFLFYASFRRSETAHASSVPDLISALPGGAPTLAYIDLAAVRASWFYQHRPDKGAITVPDRNYAEFVRSTGFDFEKDLDRVVIAAWPASLEPVTQMSSPRMPALQNIHPRKIIVIADGRFDHAKIRDYARREGKIDQEDGREVFRFPADDQIHWNSISFLNDHRIAIVEGSSIAPLLGNPGANLGDHSGNAPHADPAQERAARLDDAAAFVITRVPPIPDKFGQGGIQSTQLASLARSVQWVTLAAAPDGDNLRVSLEGECATSTDARQLQAALEVLRLFGRAALESPKTRQSMDPAALAVAESVLNTAEVTATAERTRILIELTPDLLKLAAPRKVQ